MLFLTGERGSLTRTWQLYSSEFCHVRKKQQVPHRAFSPVRNDKFGMTRFFMMQAGTAPGRTTQTSTVADLARFFPEATPVRIPVQFTRRDYAGDSGQPGAVGVEESTVIEFGTSREVLFACATPLEFADILRLRNSDGSLDTEASVVAVQYHPGKTIVAARFVNAVPNWIVKS
jgi:hypothetical protein